MLRVRLLIGAWAPGAFIAAFRAADDHPAWAAALAVVGFVAVVSVLALLRVRSTINEQPFVVTLVSDESTQVPAYLLTFVFPFVFLNARNWGDVAAYAVLGALVAVLVVRTDLVLVQPLLLAVGYHLYKIETSSGFTGLLLSSTRPLAGQTIGVVHLAPFALKLTLVQP
jgi:hypothetical protein